MTNGQKNGKVEPIRTIQWWVWLLAFIGTSSYFLAGHHECCQAIPAALKAFHIAQAVRTYSQTVALLCFQSFFFFFLASVCNALHMHAALVVECLCTGKQVGAGRGILQLLAALKLLCVMDHRGNGGVWNGQRSSPSAVIAQRAAWRVTEIVCMFVAELKWLFRRRFYYEGAARGMFS